jgi:pyruvate formate lyase activating enzyme
LRKLSPEEVVEATRRSGCPSIAYTYNEPTVWYEWVLDTAKLARKKGLKNVLVTNGFINREPILELAPYLDAANVDLKGDKEFYRELCKVGHHEVVRETCKILKEKNVHLETTNLIVTSKNDSDEQIKEIISFVKDELGPETPLHFSRYRPMYKLKLPPTPIETLHRAYDLAKDAGLSYVYLGNISSEITNHTYCKECGNLLIERNYYHVRLIGLDENNRCKKCGTEPDIIWK